MEQVQIPAFSDPLPVPIPLLKEKPRQGVPGNNPAPHPGHDLHNSTVAIGLRAALHLNAVRSRSTGKERDAESGNDYFGARYYASTMGRFLSPDWSDPAQPIPYASLHRPQSLNLYSYVENNPLSQIDDDGHSTVIFDGQAQTITVRANDGTETTFPASNNPQMSLTIGKLVDGNYAFLDTTRPHHHSPEEDSHNGAYGPGGIFRLKPFKGADGKEHDGVGLHAGRADSTDRAGRSGCNYATNGCVRTTEKAIQFIINLAPGDPLTDLQVRNNRKPPKDDHGDHPSPNPAPKPPPHLIPRADGGGDDQ
jgi:RHS repeat-associated protein